MVVVATIFIVYTNTRTNSVAEKIENEQNIHLVFLVHNNDELLFTEILFYNTATSRGALLDIPGETGQIIEKIEKIDRIDKLYNQNNPQEYINGIEKMIQYPIHYYIQIDINNFESIVDIIGGIEIFVDNPVEVVEDDEIIFLPSGSVRLDGSKIKTYIEYEDEEEPEIEKSERYEKIIQAFLKTLIDENNVLTSPEILKYIKKNIDTNADEDSMISFLQEIVNMDANRLVFQYVLGVRRTVDDQELLFSHYNGNLLRETIKQTISSLESLEIVSSEDLNTTIQILNGTQVNGLASRTSRVFQSFGYEVAYIGNYTKQDVEKTLVIERLGDGGQAEKVAGVIDCNNIETISVEDNRFNEFFNNVNDNEIDVIIILGGDFDGRYCK